MKNLSWRLIIFALLIPLPVLAADDPARQVERDRARQYLQAVPDAQRSAWGAVVLLASGRTLPAGVFDLDLAQIDQRLDCADFDVAALLRILYLFPDNPNLTPDHRRKITASLLGFKYWIDEPGHDSMCYWSENHQVLFHSAEYLVGNLFPDQVFANNGMTGAQHREKGKMLVEQWLGWREKFGFAEWLSNVYFDEDLAGLFNLVDFAPDPEIRARAAMAIDQIALNMALNSYRGVFVATHGRTYGKDSRFAEDDNTKVVNFIWFGMRPFTPAMARPSRSGAGLATSTYRLPTAIRAIGTDPQGEWENYQTQGASLADAAAQGVSHDNFDHGMFFWGMGMYTHPKVVDLSAQMWEKWDLGSNMFFLGLASVGVKAAKRGWLDKFFDAFRVASEGAYLDDSHTYTYRTPDYILSAVLDRRAGDMGSQQRAWAAGLGGDAIVFTTHPASVIGGSPGAWTGNASQPRVAQKKNVLIAIYNPSPGLYIGEFWRRLNTHAWFPSRGFDEVRRSGRWTFGRKGKGYIGLWSAQAAWWADPVRNELLAPGIRNVWVVEMGAERTDGSFDNFVSKLTAAKVTVGADLQTRYRSPSLGEVEWGWKGPFRVAGAEVPLRRGMRYDNPFVQAVRFGPDMEVRAGGSRLRLDFAAGERTAE